MPVTAPTSQSTRGPSTPKLTTDGAHYKLWKQIMDANIKTLIYDTCDHHLLQIVSKDNCTAQQLLASIDEFFVSNKRSCSLQVQGMFRTIEKGDMNVNEFCYTLKNLYDVLNDVDGDGDSLVSERELVMQILRQMPVSYDSVVESIRKAKPFPSFYEAKNMLLEHELREKCIKNGFETPQNSDLDLDLGTSRNGKGRRRRKENGKKKMGGGAPEEGNSNEFGVSDKKFVGDQHGEQVQNQNSNGSNSPQQPSVSLPPAEHGQPMLAANQPRVTTGFGSQQQLLPNVPPSQPQFTAQAQQFGSAFSPQHAQHSGPQSYQAGQQYGQQSYNQFGQRQFWQPSQAAYSPYGSQFAEYSFVPPTSQITDLSSVISPMSLQPPNADSKCNKETGSTSHINDKSKKIVVGNSDVLPDTHTDTTKLTFQGDIVYSRTFSEVEKATDELLKFVETKYKDGGRPVIGLDVEWKPTFRKGQKESKAAVLQICADATNCHVMHIIHSGFPQNLQNLLGDTTFLKVGVGIAGDARKVFKDHKVSVEALQDLSRLANQKFGGKPKMWGLSSLTEKLTCKQVPKPKKITLGNWEANPLSTKQLEYAATDAYVSLFLFEVLNRLPDASANTLTSEAVEATVPS